MSNSIKSIIFACIVVAVAGIAITIVFDERPIVTLSVSHLESISDTTFLVVKVKNNTDHAIFVGPEINRWGGTIIGIDQGREYVPLSRWYGKDLGRKRVSKMLINDVEFRISIDELIDTKKPSEMNSHGIVVPLLVEPSEIWREKLLLSWENFPTGSNTQYKLTDLESSPFVLSDLKKL